MFEEQNTQFPNTSSYTSEEHPAWDQVQIRLQSCNQSHSVGFECLAKAFNKR
jgi:hypothetical protein